MGWFSSKPKEPDAIDLICQSLRDRYWEWRPGKSKQGRAMVEHLSGTAIVIEDDRRSRRVWMGDDVCPETDLHAAKRLYAAYQQHLAAKVSSEKGAFDQTALTLAKAVIEGDKVAARALIDHLVEVGCD